MPAGIYILVPRIYHIPGASIYQLLIKDTCAMRKQNKHKLPEKSDLSLMPFVLTEFGNVTFSDCRELCAETK